jgi:hypothetical protein
MIIEPGLPDHWKVRELKRLSGKAEVIEWLIRLWGNCHTRKSSRFDNDPGLIASICFYDGDPNQFTDWLLRVRFLELDGNNLIARGWDEYNARLLANWANGPKGGRPPGGKHKVYKAKKDKAPASENGDKDLELPEDLRTPELVAAWADWRKNRSQIGHKLTPIAAQQQIKSIREWGPERAVAALKHSIAGNYQGLFEPKRPTPMPPPQRKLTSPTHL